MIVRYSLMYSKNIKYFSLYASCITATFLKPMHFDKVNVTFIFLLKASNERVEHKNLFEINGFSSMYFADKNIRIHSVSLLKM